MRCVGKKKGRLRAAWVALRTVQQPGFIVIYRQTALWELRVFS